MLGKQTQVKAGEFTGKIVEYFAHRFLHSRGIKKGSFFDYHLNEHHQRSNQNGLVDEAYIGSEFLDYSRVREKLGLAFLVLMFLPTKPFLPYFYEEVKAQARDYDQKHARAHRDPYYMWEHLPNHALHHTLYPNAYWGVRDSTLDNLLGTAPEVDPKKLERIKRIYIERGEKALPVVKAEAKRKQEEFEQRCMGVFNKAMDGLDYAAGKRWELERIVRGVRSKIHF